MYKKQGSVLALLWRRIRKKRELIFESELGSGIISYFMCYFHIQGEFGEGKEENSNKELEGKYISVGFVENT